MLRSHERDAYAFLLRTSYRLFVSNISLLPLHPSCASDRPTLQLEVTRVPADEMDRVDDTNRASVSAEDKTSGGVLCRPPRPGAPQSLAGSRGVAGGCCGLAGVKEGSATDQEEGGGQRERGRPSSALSGKSSKIEDGLSSLRIGVTTGTDGVSGGDGGAGGGLLEGGEHWGRQDSSRSPLPHHNAAGGEDDASVLDTPLQDMVSVDPVNGRREADRIERVSCGVVVLCDSAPCMFHSGLTGTKDIKFAAFFLLFCRITSWTHPCTCTLLALYVSTAGSINTMGTVGCPDDLRSSHVTISWACLPRYLGGTTNRNR